MRCREQKNQWVVKRIGRTLRRAAGLLRRLWISGMIPAAEALSTRRSANSRRASVAQAYEPSGRSVPNANRFFDALKRAELRGETLQSIAGALTVLLAEDDDEGLAPPDFGSFVSLLTFLRWHPELPPPALGVSPAGLFAASWEAGAFELEFQPERRVHWARSVKLPDKIEVSGGPADLDSIQLPDSLRRVAA